LNIFPETITWKQGITKSFSCDFNKTPHHLVPKLLPMATGFTKDILTPPQTTERKSMTQVRLSKPYNLLTSFHRTKDCTTSFSRQTLAYHAPSAGSYDERCGTDSEISVK
jgi:hypothetical protein